MQGKEVAYHGKKFWSDQVWNGTVLSYGANSTINPPVLSLGQECLPRPDPYYLVGREKIMHYGLGHVDGSN